MAGIAAALNGGSSGEETPSEVSPTEEIPDSGSPFGDITNMPDLSNDQNDQTAGNAGSGVDNFLAGLTAAW